MLVFSGSRHALALAGLADGAEPSSRRSLVDHSEELCLVPGLDDDELFLSTTTNPIGARGRPQAGQGLRRRSANPSPGRDGARRLSARTLHMAASYLAATVVVLCPLPFGSVETAWVLFWCTPLAVSLPLFDWRRLRRAHLVRLAPCLVMMTCLLSITSLQTRPDQTALGGNPLWREAASLLGTPSVSTVSVYPAKTLSALAPPILLFLAFVCSFGGSLDRKGAKIIFSSSAYAGAAYALYGISALLLDPTTLLGSPKVAYVGDLTSTFVNRNTAATFFGTALILWSARALLETDERLPRTRVGVRDVASVFLDHPSRGLVVALAGAFLCFTALMLTRSRAGILLTLSSLFVMCAILLRHRLAARAVSVAWGAGVLLAGGLLLEFLGGAIAGRLGSLGLVDAGRLSVFTSSLSIIGDHPLLGTGLGTFGDVYSSYRTADSSTQLFWDKTHNTLLETATELGLPFALLVLGCWVSGLFWLLSGGLARQRDSRFALTAFAIGLLGSLHSLVDFSPQIAGFGVFWVALLGCGLAQSVRSGSGERGNAGGIRLSSLGLPGP